MIKDLDNCTILRLTIADEDVNVAKAGDILVYTTGATRRWELCKAGLTANDTVFAIIVDDADKTSTRLCAVDGIVEANVGGTYAENTLLYFNPLTQYLVDTKPTGRVANAQLIKMLPPVGTKQRALVRVFNNTNSVIT